MFSGGGSAPPYTPRQRARPLQHPKMIKKTLLSLETGI